MEEKLEEAVNYANGSNSLENNKLTPDELNQIISDIKNGKTDDSFLFAVVKMIKRKENREFEIEQEEARVYGKIR